MRFTRQRTPLVEDLKLLGDGGFTSELRPICFAVTGAGAVEVFPNWLYCNGFAVSRTTYARLFAEIGTTYGVGDGSTTFNLPDFRGRSPLPHADGQTGSTRVANAGSVGNATAPGGVGGADTVALSKPNLPAHVHDKGTLSITAGGSHTHGIGTLGLVNGGGAGSITSMRQGQAAATTVNLTVSGSSDSATHSHASSDFSGSTEDGTVAGLGSGTPSHNNIHPHLPATGMVIRA